MVEENAKVITEKINQISLSNSEKAIVSNGKIKKNKNQSINEITWKIGKFEFANTPLVDLILVLESFYKVKIDLIADFKVSYPGNFDNDPIAQVLSTIAESTNCKVQSI